jgi:exodeoxyribonuclease-3
MRIISWNTNGLRATHKQGHFDALFRDYDPDIVCLQETKATPDQLPLEVRDVFGYESYFHAPSEKKGYSGVGVYTKASPSAVTYGLGIPELDTEGRLITLEYDGYYLINCYFPNGGGAPERLEYKLAFYDAFLSYVDKLQKKKPVIWCGDVNVAHTEIDLARPKENADHVGFLPIERAWMDKVVAQGWVDVFRHLHPDTCDVYTYWDQKSGARNRNVGWRIDYFFVSAVLIGGIKGFETLTEYYGSDHCPIMLAIDL